MTSHSYQVTKSPSSADVTGTPTPAGRADADRWPGDGACRSETAVDGGGERWGVGSAAPAAASSVSGAGREGGTEGARRPAGQTPINVLPHS